MAFHPFAATIPHVIYAILGGFIVLFGMFSLLLREKLYVGEACWAFVFGIAMGPYGANIFNPRGWGNADQSNTITLELTRVVLAIGVFAIGVELPKAYMKKHWKSLFFLLAPVMTWGWFVSAGLIFALIPGLNFRSSLAVAACLTPTDPILAAAVVGGKYADKHVPAHIRHLLAAESGCNDGAAFPFLFIALYLITDSPSTGNAIKDWFLLLWLYQIIMGTVIGSLVGFSFRHLMKYCEQHNLIDRHSYVAQYVSLAIFTIGVTVMLGSDDLLATFSCGTAFAWDGFFNRQTEESNFSSVIDLLFNIGAFIFLGAWMPFDMFDNEDLTLTVWRLIVIAILVMLLRRLPIMIALYKWIPDIKTLREAVFCGHFGPIGVGAVFISTLATQFLQQNAQNASPQTQLLTNAMQPIVAFMVLCSVVVHGLSIPSFSLGRRVHSVSRTWSRHTSLGGGGLLPDWTNQARLVRRGDDEIVINRDREDEMEKGEVVAVDEEKGGREEEESASGSGTMVNSRQLDDAAAESSTGQGHGGQDYREETPPDGTEILSEWQEGPHTIVERRAGPGEEVEVEVIRNNNPSGSGSSLSAAAASASRIFRGHRSHVRNHLNEHLTHFKDATFEEFEQEAHRAKEMVKDAENTLVRVISPRFMNRNGSDEDTEHQRREADSGDSAVVEAREGDEEEGWASEKEEDDDNDQASSRSVITMDSRKKSRSPKTRTESIASGSGASGSPRQPSVTFRKGTMTRRRNSMRKGLMGQAYAAFRSGHGHSAPSQQDDEEQESRGRRPYQPHRHSDSSSSLHQCLDQASGSSSTIALSPAPTGAHSSSSSTPSSPSSPVSPRNSRVQHLRLSIHQRRDLSPVGSVRSIRFADQEDEGSGRSGTSTPRIPASGSNGSGLQLASNGSGVVPAGGTPAQQDEAEDGPAST